MSDRIMFAASIGLMISAWSSPIGGQCTVVEDQALGTLGRVTYQGAVGMDGNLAAVASLLLGVEVYRRNGSRWVYDELIPTPSATTVAVGAETIAVGVPSEVLAGTRGVVRIYKEHGGAWVNAQKLNADGRNFGDAVAFDETGSLLVTTSTRPDTVHMFRHDGTAWRREAALGVPGGSLLEVSIAASEGLVIVGTPFTSGPAGANQGSAYVFRETSSGWVQEDMIQPSQSGAGDRVGWSVAVENGTAVVGGYSGSADPAYVYRFQGGAWQLEQALQPERGFYGSCVALEDDWVMVGAECLPAGVMGGGCSGNAYLYRREGTVWQMTATLGSAGRNTAMGGAGAMDDGRVVLWASEDYQAYTFSVADFSLTSDQTQLNPGDTLTLTVGCGTDSQPVRLCVVSFKGFPKSICLVTSSFNQQGQFSYQAVIPLGLSGLQAQLQASGLFTTGRIGISNRVSIQFL